MSARGRIAATWVLLVAGAAHGQGWIGAGSEPVRPPPLGEGALVNLNMAIEKFWIHQGGPQPWNAPPPHAILREYFRGDRRLRRGAALPEELEKYRDGSADLARSLVGILDAGAERALVSRAPVLTSDWPGPALWRRVNIARTLLLLAMVEGRWEDLRRMSHALFVLGSLVTRGREGDERPGRMVHLRVGMEVQLAVLHVLLRADGDGWLTDPEERQALSRLLASWLRERVPWHVFEDPTKVETDSWFGATTHAPQGAKILHKVGAYREVLLHGLAHALALPRDQAPEGWPGGRAQDPLAERWTDLGLRAEPGGWLRIWSVGFDGRDDGGDREKDIVLYPYPADGWYRRPVPGL